MKINEANGVNEINKIFKQVDLEIVLIIIECSNLSQLYFVLQQQANKWSRMNFNLFNWNEWKRFIYWLLLVMGAARHIAPLSLINIYSKIIIWSIINAF